MVHDELPDDVPEGAAVFPLIPEELGIDPLLLAVLHSAVFLLGSDEQVVEPSAAEEVLQYILSYTQRLQGDRAERIQEDFTALIEFARQDDWPKQDIHFLRSFRKEFGAAGSSEE